MKRLVFLAGSATLILGVIFASPSARGQSGDKGDKKADGKSLDNPYYPLAIGTTWEYMSSGKKIVVKVAAHEMVDGVNFARLETDAGVGLVTEHITVKPDGIYRVRAKDQDIKPPLLIFKLPAKKGDTWQVESTVQNFPVKGKYTMGEEELKIGKEKYDTVSVKSSDLVMDGKSVSIESWYAKDIGLVKQHMSLPAANLDIVLELSKFEKGK